MHETTEGFPSFILSVPERIVPVRASVICAKTTTVQAEQLTQGYTL